MFKISTISALQAFHFFRFLCFLGISIFFTKVELTQAEIGSWEFMMFLTAALSFFWTSGILQSLLPIAHRNKVFGQHDPQRQRRSPELFNSFILLLFFSVVFSIFIGTLGFTFPHVENHPAIFTPVPLILYFIFNSTAPLIEHIFLLQNKAKAIFWYGVVIMLMQIVGACAPIVFGYGIEEAVYGLMIVNAVRFVFLLGMLHRYAKACFSWQFIKDHLSLGAPIMLSTLLSGSTQYIDSFVATIAFDSERFAIFRYGCKELPFVVMATSGLHSAMLPRFADRKKIKNLLKEIKRRSLRQMHWLYPLSIAIMLFSTPIFRGLFNNSFSRSADVFMVYQLMIISRVLYPHTILIGLKKTRILMWASIAEIVLNIPLSLLLVGTYGVVGIALGSCFIHIVEKFILMRYLQKRLSINFRSYTPWGWYVFYSLLIGLTFILIDHRIVYFP